MTTLYFMTRFISGLASGMLVIAVIGGFSLPAGATSPVHMQQVNAALREAGLPVTEFSQRSFAAGVEAGHYRTYEQLVNAMKWHKKEGRTIARFGVFGSFNEPPIIVRAKGVVANITEKKLELTDVQVHGQVTQQKFDIKKDTILETHLMRGSTVSVQYLPGTLVASRVENVAPEGLEKVWGPIGN